MYLQGPDGPATEYKGVETIEMVAGDRFSKSEFVCKFGDRDFEGHSLLGWDPQKEKYTGLWVDSFNAAPTAMTGTYDREKKTLTMHSTVVDGSGNELKQKQVTTYLDENKKRFESYLIVEQGGRPLEVKLMEITSTRRP